MTAQSKEEKQLQEVLSVIHKKYGAGSLIDYGSVDKIEPIETISTGLATLDLILGGGVPKGRIMELFGQFSSGKSTLALQMIAKCQKDGRRVAYIDAENALDPEYAQKMGVDMSKLLLSQPSSGEEAMDIVEKLCQSNQISCIVIDSVAQLVPMAVAAKEIDGTANIATTARLLSQTLPRISNAAARSGTVLIFINQIRSMVGNMYGPTETTPGGYALKFASSIRIETRAGKVEERNGKEGCVIKVTVKKNKIARPFRKAELFLIYGEGFDVMQIMFDTALYTGLIEQAGAWFIYGEIKEQGFQKMCDKLKADDKILKEIEDKLSKIKIK
jgi:recombination protein RecA